MFTLGLLGAKKSLALGGAVAGATIDEEGGGWATIEGGAPAIDPAK